MSIYPNISRLSSRVCQTVTLILLLTAGIIPVAGRDILRDSVEVHFRQGRSVLDTAFRDNGLRLDSLVSELELIPASSIVRVSVTGGASPEGSAALNMSLSRKRAESIFDYIDRRITLPDSCTSFSFLGRDWRGLRDMVMADPDVPMRSDVLRLLDAIPDHSTDISAAEGRETLIRLAALDRGVPYLYLYNKIFPALRRSMLIVEYNGIPVQSTPLPVLSSFPLPALRPTPRPSVWTWLPVHPAPVSKGHPFYMALKTNLLFDILAVPQLGAEFYLGRGWSVVASGEYSWWSCDRRHRYWRIYGGELALRHWFGGAASLKPLTGHHLGLYGGVVTFDFEMGGTGYMGGIPRGTLLDRCLYYGGVEYGYSLPIAKRLNIDFTLGLGYFGGRYFKYVPIPAGYLEEVQRRISFFGPTKAEISLVWLIGKGNTNRRKGGDR